MLIVQENHTQEMIARNGGTIAFSDGSFKANQWGGFGVFVPQLDLQAAYARPEWNLENKSAISFELLGIQEALTVAVKMNLLYSPIYIYTDSFDALTLLKMHAGDHGVLKSHSDYSTIQSIFYLATSASVQVSICKVKGHSDVVGNNIADMLARTGAQLPVGMFRMWGCLSPALSPCHVAPGFPQQAGYLPWTCRPFPQQFVSTPHPVVYSAY